MNFTHGVIRAPRTLRCGSSGAVPRKLASERREADQWLAYRTSKRGGHAYRIVDRGSIGVWHWTVGGLLMVASQQNSRHPLLAGRAGRTHGFHGGVDCGHHGGVREVRSQERVRRALDRWIRRAIWHCGFIRRCEPLRGRGLKLSSLKFCVAN